MTVYMIDWKLILFNFLLVGMVIWRIRAIMKQVVPQMDYVVIFDVRAEVVNVVGVFHQLENYQSKL